MGGVRLITSTRQAAVAHDIPVDAMSAAETRYYLHQLALTPTQAPQFLAQLSGNPLASDSYLRTLRTPADRRSSLETPLNSPARTACFELRCTLVEAFFEHAGRADQARAAVATATPVDAPSAVRAADATTCPPQGPPPASTPPALAATPP